MGEGEGAGARPGGGVAARAFDRVALALLLLTVADVLREPLRIHHDPANLLTSSLCWIEGRARLETMANMNLPLSLYLYGLPASISHALSAHPVPVFSFFTLLVLVVSGAACRGLLGRGAPGSAAARSFFALAVAGLALATRGRGELAFGQREVFYIALVLPFLLVRWRRAEGVPPGGSWAALAGVSGALGALLKPQLLLPVACAELALWISGRRPRLVRAPESLAFGVTGLVYAFHFLLLPKEVVGAFGSAAAGAAEGYRAYDAPLLFLLLRGAIPPAILVSIAGLAAGRAKGADPFSRLSAAFAGLTLGGLAVYFLQHKGFTYHLVPTVAGTVLAAAALVASGVAARLRESWIRRARRLGPPVLAIARATPLLAAAACVLAASRLPVGLDPAPRTEVEELFAYAMSPREEALAITTSVAPLYPALIRMDRRPFAHCVGPFMGIAFAHAGDPRGGPPRYPSRSEMAPLERISLDSLTHEVLAAPPRLVLIAGEPPHQGMPRRFDLHEYLRVAGFVEEALAGFERVEDRAGFVVYRLRTPRAPASGDVRSALSAPRRRPERLL